MAHPQPFVSRRTAALSSGHLLSHLFPASEEDGRAVVLWTEHQRFVGTAALLYSPLGGVGTGRVHRLRASRIRRESVTA